MYVQVHVVKFWSYYRIVLLTVLTVVGLCNSFESTGDKADRISKASHQICMTHFSKLAYQNNVRTAYDILSQNKGSSFCANLLLKF